VTLPHRNTTTTSAQTTSTPIQEPPGTHLQIVEDFDDPEDTSPQPTESSQVEAQQRHPCEQTEGSLQDIPMTDMWTCL